MIQIIDVELGDLHAPLEISEDRCLIRFWVEDWPVGQIPDDNARRHKLDLGSLVERAVDPEVMAYAKDGVARNKGRGSPGDATVVICTRDRPQDLARCLASLSEQTLTPKQIIVVDNASVDDRTRDVALAAGVDYVRETRPGLDFARNTGAQASIASIVAYTDDDVVLHPRWLERMVAAFDDDQIGAVTGLVLPGELNTEAQIFFEEHWSFGRGFARIDFGERFFAEDHRTGCPAWEIGAGASMALRREVFARIGGFDERLDAGAAGCSGDSEYWHRLLTHDYVCRYEPGAVAYHFHRREMRALSRQIYMYMRGHAAALLVQYERTGNRGNLNRIVRILPLYYLERAAKRLLMRGQKSDCFLLQEIGGFISGLFYYLRHRRPARRTGIS